MLINDYLHYDLIMKEKSSAVKQYSKCVQLNGKLVSTSTN